MDEVTMPRSNSRSSTYRNDSGMVVISSTLTVGSIGHALDQAGEPIGEGGLALARTFPRFADDLAWWTAAAREQKKRVAPPY